MRGERAHDKRDAERGETVDYFSIRLIAIESSCARCARRFYLFASKQGNTSFQVIRVSSGIAQVGCFVRGNSMKCALLCSGSVDDDDDGGRP